MYKQKFDHNHKNEPISVVICAHNEEPNLRELLPTLYKQNYPEFELIVVDDRSTDGTQNYLREEEINHPKLTRLRIDKCPDHINEKKYALTLGIKAAKNEWILFTDADCIPSSKMWIYEMSRAFNEQTEIVLGYSPYEKQKGFLNYFIRFETLYTAIQYLSLALAGSPYMGVGRNMAYRKSLFLNNNGFNRQIGITGGDDDLFINAHAHKKNTKVVIGKNNLVRSIPKTTIKSYFRQKKRHLSVGKHYKSSDKFILGLLSVSHLIYWASLICLAVLNEEPYWIGGGFLIRIVVQFSVFEMAKKKLGEGPHL
ncbi:glycosyltransferase, partial [Xanthovirga aplysinae]|uniref:glycosyltransferase n=1 Tax=Xanthovirga aplysinae TaxID=2529853 RepID=UPI001656BF33